MTIQGRVISGAALVVGAIILIALGSCWRSWNVEQKAAKSEIAQPTKESEKWERQMEALTLAVARLSDAQATALATKYARPDIRVIPGPPGAPGRDGETKVLTETKTSTPAEAGVSILTTVDKAGKVENTVVANPVRFWGAPLKFRWYGEALWDLDHGGSLGDPDAVRLGAEFRALRLGHFEVGPKLELFRERLPDYTFDTGGRVGLRVTFER